MSTSESTIKHSGHKSPLKSYRLEMKLEKMSIDLSWLGNSRIPKFVPFEWQLKAAKCCRPMAAGVDAASQYWVHGDGGRAYYFNLITRCHVNTGSCAEHMIHPH
ncbi:hypothetical protein C8J56DRAFT_884277 [Mycena floridula]|nr:hypothetical protein C8J56DRAFT_884277 [Mycena floridula]